MRFYVGTGITDNYFPRTERYQFFPSLDHAKTPYFQPFTALIDYPDYEDEWMRAKFPDIDFVPMRMADVLPKNDFKCVQHGAFVEPCATALGWKDDDYVIFIDSDLTVQRTPTVAELYQFTSGRVLLASNWRDGETLGEEFSALQPRVSSEEMERWFPGFRELPCYNTGVLGMKVSDWRRVFARYLELYPMVGHALGHYARMQWLICWVIHELKLDLFDPKSDLVRTLHAHGHEPSRADRLRAQGVHLKDGIWMKDGTPIVFAHHF